MIKIINQIREKPQVLSQMLEYFAANCMDTDLAVYAAANVVKLFVQTLVFFQTISFLYSGLAKWLYDGH